MKDKLQAIRDALADGKQWCQGHRAEDRTGSPCHVTEGCKWCLLGMITKLFPREATNISQHLLPYAKRLYGRLYLADVNDWDGHAAVLNLLDTAIKEAA